jgi:hypothetical protein
MAVGFARVVNMFLGTPQPIAVMECHQSRDVAFLGPLDAGKRPHGAKIGDHLLIDRPGLVFVVQGHGQCFHFRGAQILPARLDQRGCQPRRLGCGRCLGYPLAPSLWSAVAGFRLARQQRPAQASRRRTGGKSWPVDLRRERQDLERMYDMRFMMLIKATPDSEAGVFPSRELVAAMSDYNEEMARAWRTKPPAWASRLRACSASTPARSMTSAGLTS